MPSPRPRLAHLLPFLLITVAGLAPAGPIHATGTDPSPRPFDGLLVYLDCRVCNVPYIQTTIPFVTYVRDQADAMLYLEVETQRTATGWEYLLLFSLAESGQVDSLSFTLLETQTPDERRAELSRRIRLGLIPHLLQSGAIESLDVVFLEQEGRPAGGIPAGEDPWDGWVFDLGARGSLSGEKSRNQFRLEGSLRAERVTPEWKIEGRLRGEETVQTFQLSEGERQVNRGYGEFETLTAYSLTDHLSLGVSTEMGYSTFRNQTFYASLSPAVEFNVFPYSDYQNRRFLFVYRISPAHRRYTESTIYGLDRQTMVQQSLSANLRYIQRWGRLETRVSGSHLLHDAAQNRLNVDTGVDVRIARGLSLNMSARYSLINDQYSLPAGQVDDQDSLLNLRQQATSYSYGMSFGFSYNFGSIYTSVVNPRF